MPNTLHYHFVLANIDLVNAGPAISEAGKPGLQHFTPVLDLEHLLYGKTVSDLPAEVSTSLYTGAFSPMVATRRLLQHFQARGWQVKLYLYNLAGLPYDYELAPNPDFEICDYYTLEEAPSRSYAGLHPVHEVIEQDIRTIASLTAHNVLAKRTPEDHHVFAECVPGGTATANLLLNLALADETVQTASSATDPAILANRTELIDSLTSSARHDIAGFIATPRTHYNAPPAQWGPRLHSHVKRSYCDYFQLFMLHLMELTPAFLKPFREYPHITLAGGVQMLAPLVYTLAAQREDVGVSELNETYDLVTTPYVFAHPLNTAHGFFQPYRFGFLNCRAATLPHFYSTDAEGWQKYDQGFAKEGCGFGGLLYLAQQYLMRTSSTARPTSSVPRQLAEFLLDPPAPKLALVKTGYPEVASFHG